MKQAVSVSGQASGPARGPGQSAAHSAGMYGVDPEGAPSVPVRFAVGERVQVRMAFPPGHVRTPFYCRGKNGVIERLCGAFPNPEELAYHRSGLPAQPLYRVRFASRELWADYAGASADVVEIEIYQHWLEAGPDAGLNNQPDSGDGA